MQGFETIPKLSLVASKTSNGFSKTAVFRNKAFVPARPVIKRAARYSPHLTLASTNEDFSSFPEKRSQHKTVPLDHFQSQAKQCVSLIEDPLWKHICTEFMHMMGPLSVLKIWKSRLSSVSPQHKTIYIHCEIVEESEFIKKYSFIILASLQKYFPAVRSIKVKT